VTGGFAGAFDGRAGAAGPARVYDVLAGAVAGCCPVDLDGALVLDVGAGTGAATRAVRARGARTVAADLSPAMLRAGEPGPAVVADATRLPFGPGVFDAVVAAFSMNHLPEPGLGLAEAARVTRPGGAVVASTYAVDDTHPVKAVVERVAAAHGWVPPPWAEELKTRVLPILGEPGRLAAEAAGAGLRGRVHRLEIPFDLTAAELVEWRLGMAQMTAFATALDPRARARLVADAVAELGAHPPLIRRVLVLAAIARNHA
jgi:SAM-dependent methyltransferase